MCVIFVVCSLSPGKFSIFSALNSNQRQDDVYSRPLLSAHAFKSRDSIHANLKQKLKTIGNDVDTERQNCDLSS